MRITGHKEKDSAYYDAIFEKGYNTSGRYFLYTEILKMVEKHRHPRVLEVGCGVGDLGKLIVEKGYAYRGFDFSEEAIRQCKESCPQGHFRVADAYDRKNYQPFDYNIAVAVEVLEHVDDIRLIQNIPTGAVLVASVPDFDDAAHLRLYQNPREDIVKRFSPYLNITEISVCPAKNMQTGQSVNIYLFQGVRKGDRSDSVIPAKKKLNLVSKRAPDAAVKKIGRNDPCPCGSGKKYKKCCLHP